MPLHSCRHSFNGATVLSVTLGQLRSNLVRMRLAAMSVSAVIVVLCFPNATWAGIGFAGIAIGNTCVLVYVWQTTRRHFDPQSASDEDLEFINVACPWELFMTLFCLVMVLPDLFAQERAVREFRNNSEAELVSVRLEFITESRHGVTVERTVEIENAQRLKQLRTSISTAELRVLSRRQYAVELRLMLVFADGTLVSYRGGVLRGRPDDIQVSADGVVFANVFVLPDAARILLNDAGDPD